MKMNEEKFLCEQCGSELHEFDELCTVGMECPNCGWCMVTTSPIISDRHTYNIFINSNILPSINNIKLISEIANCNYITAKKLIESAPVQIFCGSAINVKSAKKKLENANITYRIKPEFPY